MSPEVEDHLRTLLVNDIISKLMNPKFLSKEEAENWNRATGKACEELGMKFESILALNGSKSERSELNYIITHGPRSA